MEGKVATKKICLNILILKFILSIHRVARIPLKFKDLIDSSNKLTTVAGRKFITKALSTQDQTGENANYFFSCLNENIATAHFYFAFRRSSPYIRKFIRIIDQLISAGIVQKIEVEGKKKLTPETVNMQLDMEQLSVCFIIVAICLSISFIVFVAECLTPRVMSLFTGRN
jgi:hypothetical protein